MDTIAFLGSGSMAAAMVEGLLAKGAYTPDRIRCIGGSGQSAPLLAKRTGIQLAGSLDELLDLVPFAIDDTEREIHLRAEALIRKIKSLEASRG